MARARARARAASPPRACADAAGRWSASWRAAPARVLLAEEVLAEPGARRADGRAVARSRPGPTCRCWCWPGTAPTRSAIADGDGRARQRHRARAADARGLAGQRRAQRAARAPPPVRAARPARRPAARPTSARTSSSPRWRTSCAIRWRRCSTALALLARNEPTPARPQRYYEHDGRQVDHMVRLVDDLMEVSRITRGKIELQLEPVALDRVVRRRGRAQPAR